MKLRIVATEQSCEKCVHADFLNKPKFKEVAPDAFIALIECTNKESVWHGLERLCTEGCMCLDFEPLEG
jgi:hypothetical protein